MHKIIFVQKLYVALDRSYCFMDVVQYEQSVICIINIMGAMCSLMLP